jgi:hypothetical protein
MKENIVYALVALALCFSSTVYADTMIDATDPDIVLDLAKGYGSATLEKASNGAPCIVGRIDGTRYGVSFNGCRDGKDCDDVSLVSYWPGHKGIELEDINGWNSKKRYAKAYIDTDGDVLLQMDLNVDYGVSRRNFDEGFRLWSRVLDSFKETVLK